MDIEDKNYMPARCTPERLQPAHHTDIELPAGVAPLPVSQESWDKTRAQCDELCIFVNDMAAILETSPFDSDGMLNKVREMVMPMRDKQISLAGVALDRIQQRLGTTIPKVPPLERVRHKKTGRTYTVISRDVRLRSGTVGCTLRDMQMMSVFTIGRGPDKQFIVRCCGDEHPKNEYHYCSARVQVNFEGVIYADMLPFVLYKAEKDGSYWLRPVSEFDDGRFETIPYPRGVPQTATHAELDAAMQVPPATPALPEPFFTVHIATLTTSAGTTHYVCIDRADRPADASPWDEQGRNMPYHSSTLANAEIVAEMWDEFLNGPAK